jgi:acyl-CoA synthetase (AMP-forming)/AMP-acid ligase II/acyl carrier protein
MMHHELNSSSSVPAVGETLVDLLRHRAFAVGDKQAFCYLPGDGGKELAITYRCLHERATAIGGRLQQLASPGERALLLFPPGLDFIAAFFGCLYAGVVAVPIAPPGRKRFAWSAEPIFEASKPSLVLSTAFHCEKAAHSYAPTPLLRTPWIAVDTIENDRRHTFREPQIDERHTAFLQYTSGSTSVPKGVMLSHQNLLHNAALIRQAFGNTSESNAVFWLPLHHDMGLIGGVIQPIYCGGSCTLLAPAAFLQRPLLWLETISRRRATVSGGPDFAFDLCARKIKPEDREGLDLSSWQVAFLGAEPIRAQTLERFEEAFAPCGFRRESFFPCYGLAEATLMVSGGPRQTAPTVIHVRGAALARHRVQDIARSNPASRPLVACGESLPGQRVAIVDPETLLACKDEEVGEIWVRGPSVACGYYSRPEATTTAFRAYLADTREGPFLRTGDLGFLRDGRLFVTGRLKDLIIIRGRNFYPEDIEQSVERAYEGLRVGYCAAFSVDGDGVERLAIVQEVEPRRRDLDTHRALLAIRRAVAARHEVEVHAIALVGAGVLPKTSSGKTRRSACREQYSSGQMEVLAEWKASMEEPAEVEEKNGNGRVPRTVTVSEVEAWLTERIAARLRLPRAHVHVSTPFVEFGMSSMDAVGIAVDLERWLGRPLSPTAIYNYPTISALARWLASQPVNSRPANESSPVLRIDAPDPGQFDREIRRLTAEEMEQFASIVEEMSRQEG